MAAMTCEVLKNLVRTAFSDAQVTVDDFTGTNDHFQITVISAAFQGESLVDRQRMVFKALGQALNGPVHALSLKTLMPGESSK